MPESSPSYTAFFGPTRSLLEHRSDALWLTVVWMATAAAAWWAVQPGMLVPDDWNGWPEIVWVILVVRGGLGAKRGWVAFLIGWLCFIPAWLITLAWIGDISVAGWPSLAIYSAFYPPTMVVLIRWLSTCHRLPMVLVGGVVGVSLEYVRAEVLFDSWPFHLIGSGMSGGSNALLAQWGGLWLVTLVVMFTGVLCVNSLIWGFFTKYDGVVVVLLIGTSFLPLPAGPIEAAPLRVLAVQTNLPQSNKMGWSHEQQATERVQVVKEVQALASQEHEARCVTEVLKQREAESRSEVSGPAHPALQAEEIAQSDHGGLILCLLEPVLKRPRPHTVCATWRTSRGQCSERSPMQLLTLPLLLAMISGQTPSQGPDVVEVRSRLVELMRAGIETSEPNHSLYPWGEETEQESLFTGSYDWHSCLIAHWCLLVHARTTGDEELSGWLTARLTEEGLANEVALFLARDPARQRTAPYDEAWFLMFLSELEEHPSSPAAISGWRKKIESHLLRRLEEIPFPERGERGYMGDYNSWLMALLLVTWSEPTDEDAKRRLHALYETKLVPRRDELAAQTSARGDDFLWLPAVLALVERSTSG